MTRNYFTLERHIVIPQAEDTAAVRVYSLQIGVLSDDGERGSAHGMIATFDYAEEAAARLYQQEQSERAGLGKAPWQDYEILNANLVEEYPSTIERHPAVIFEMPAPLEAVADAA